MLRTPDSQPKEEPMLDQLSLCTRGLRHALRNSNSQERVTNVPFSARDFDRVLTNLHLKIAPNKLAEFGGVEKALDLTVAQSISHRAFRFGYNPDATRPALLGVTIPGSSPPHFARAQLRLTRPRPSSFIAQM
jgi:hypothetical protein